MVRHCVYLHNCSHREGSPCESQAMPVFDGMKIRENAHELFFRFEQTSDTLIHSHSSTQGAVTKVFSYIFRVTLPSLSVTRFHLYLGTSLPSPLPTAIVTNMSPMNYQGVESTAATGGTYSYAKSVPVREGHEYTYNRGSASV